MPMKIKTSGGKVFDINIICSDIRSKNRVLIELDDDRTLAEIAGDFDGLDSFQKYDEALDGVFETYEGFRHLVTIRRVTESGAVRLTLERSDSK